MNTEKFVDDTVVFDLYDMGVKKTLVTLKSKVDCVVGLGHPEHCVVIVNTVQYAVKGSEQEICNKVYGAADLTDAQSDN